MHRLVVAVAALAVTVSLSAQQLESFAGLRLRFESPGARSAAMGGASEALIDPFTATTNPASLAKQRERRAAIEARDVAVDTEYVTGGTVGALDIDSFESSSSGISSAIVVLPGARTTWAFHYDEPVNMSADTTGIPRTNNVLTVGIRGNELVPVEECTPPRSDCVLASFSVPILLPATANLRVRRYGASAGTALGRLSLGGTIHYAQLDEHFDNLGASQEASGGRWTWNAGAQYELSPRVRLGASYRSGASYDATRRVSQPNGFEVVDAEFRTPSSYAGGFAADLTSNLTFAADAVRVHYSEANAARFQTDTPEMQIYYDFPDVTELHAGLEYRLNTRVPVALRAGWWSDPAHRAQARGGYSGIAPSINALMLPDSGENHVTAGIGFGSRVRFDAALDRSEHTTRASVSVASRF